MARLTLCVAIAVSLVGVATVNAQDKRDGPTPGDEMIYKYLCAETDKLSKKFLDGAQTLAEWQKKRPRLYQEYMDMLGLWPLPEKTPLKATVTGTLERHGVVIEKLHFQSKPGLYVTGNLYRPKTPPAPPCKGGESSCSPPLQGGAGGGKLPAVLYVCGHSNKGRDGNKTAFQDHGLWYANNGYIYLVIDTLQLGEIPGVHHGTYGRPWLHLKQYEASRERKRPEDVTETRWWWHSLGYTPAGVEAWNGIRAIDYLLTRPDVDPDKIGVTGISGGGAATFWIAAADERVKVAVPVSGMSDLESYVKNKVINGHCDCMFLYNTYQWDWTTIAALVAPRPLLFANSDNDKIFPMDGNRRIMVKLRKLYEMYEKPELVDDYVSAGGHDYRPDLRIAISKFMNKHLKGDAKAKVEDTRYENIAGADLRVFPKDADIPKDAINHKIDETFVAHANVKLPEVGKFAEWKQTLLDELRQRSLRSLACELPAGIPEKKVTQLDGKPSWIAVIRTEPGIQVDGFHILKSGKTRFLDVMGGSNAIKTLKLLPAGNGFVMWPRGLGVDDDWNSKSPPNYVARSHALLGPTVDEGRVRDIIAAIRFLKQQEKESIPIYGQGEAGILAAYAALFEPFIKEVVVIDPPKSHREGPHFLNVLRVLDIPEALGLLAPRPLTIIGGDPKAFDRTAEIYRLAGAADKLTRKEK